MSNDLPPTGADANEDPDLGEPVAELAALEVELRQGFLARLRRRIDRRSLSGEMLVVSWELPKMVLLEFLRLLFDLCSPSEGDRK